MQHLYYLYIFISFLQINLAADCLIFYNFQTFNSLEELREKGKKYLERSNKIPMATLGYKTPLEKRKELLIWLFLNCNTFTRLVNAK